MTVPYKSMHLYMKLRTIPLYPSETKLLQSCIPTEPLIDSENMSPLVSIIMMSEGGFLEGADVDISLLSWFIQTR